MTDRPIRLVRTIKFGIVAGLAGAVVGCNTLERADASHGRPELNSVERGQARGTDPAVRPNRHVTRIGSYLFHTDVPIDSGDSTFRDLEDLPDQIESELKVPTGNGLIHVYVYAEEANYHAFLRAKDDKLPLRSAYFFAEPGKGFGMPPSLHVYTWASPRLQTDLRHELTHALLHGTLKSVPLWLDEGLAGFFEQPTSNDGVNPMHLDVLRHGEAGHPAPRFDLARLEKLSQVNQMGRAEYQEAWAWVHFMMRSNPKARVVLLEHLHSLRSTHSAGLLLPKLEAVMGDPHPALTAYISKLELPAAITRVRLNEQ